MFEYFVSFFAEENGKICFFGNEIIPLKTKIESKQEIDLVEETISQKNNGCKVRIAFFRPLRKTGE